MKKLIAIAVVFALATGAVFAETAISGTVSVRANLFSATIDDIDGTSAGVAGGGIETVYIQFSGTNDEGTFGGLFRLRGSEATKYHRAFAWWKPIPQLQIFFGQDPDGKFGPYNAWSFFQGQEDYANVHDWDAWRAPFPGNWDSFGLAFSLYPVDGLEVNLVVPLAGGIGSAAANWEGSYRANTNFYDIFGGSLELAASYAIPQIGKLFLTLIGPNGNNPAKNYQDQPNNIPPDFQGATPTISIFDPDIDVPNYGKLGLSFLLTAVEGLDVQLGFSTILPGEVEDHPSWLGLIANYTGGDWGVRFRSRLVLSGAGGKDNYVKDGSDFGFDVQPWYNFGTFSAYLSVGMVSTQGTTGDPVVQFVLNPYIKASFGPGSLRLGVVFHDPNLDKDNDARFRVPLIFGYSF
jgi:hypothetical protein